MESVQNDSTIEIAILKNAYTHTQNTKFLPWKKVRFTEFNLNICNKLCNETKFSFIPDNQVLLLYYVFLQRQ